jgi:NADH-quinone oxidoreductase subunit I
MSVLGEIIGGAKSLLVGMGVTLKAMFQPTVTVHYPYETAPVPDKFRGHPTLLIDPEDPTKTLCIVCMACQRECPSGCIKKIEGEKREGATKKTATVYLYDYSTCSQCGLCNEACPVDALTFSRDYNMIGLGREDLVFDLVKECLARKVTR